MKKEMSHKERTIKFLKTHKKMSPVDAINFGHIRLGSTINRLRKEGYVILTDFHDRHGRPSKMAYYTLVSEPGDNE